ncbi:uncharacterized protein KY384_001935 [Bacidia gigantensis]|uniref:uncharacterized protein n=1 Tax=Bacidia gigantensis TaxID=2732470 RepID=UPI001D04231F|nr:uncharacterized protein KY384_001935 [Bacidia gigantensis]KAG8533152.1 hypothetical protein KY384_001935 [Bacidia gigantensis]
MTLTSPTTILNHQHGNRETCPLLHEVPVSLRHQRRRHSAHQPVRQNSLAPDPEAIFLKVDLFVTELERRLNWIEAYGNITLDAGISRAYHTLDAVRDSCSHVSGELIGAGRRRARIFVDTVEERYKHALATKETLEGKAQAGMRMMEGFLAELEARALAVKQGGLSEVIDGGWRIAEGGVQRAREVVDEGIEKARRARESLKESVEHAVQRAREHRLITYDDLPHPWRVNPYILRGYRFSENKLDCVKSVFNYSNETVNIWSHVIGLIIVLAVAFYFYPTSVNFSQSSKADVFFAAAFFFAAAKCLICSCMWHTMSSISEQTVMERFACVDYTGISLLIAASIMTSEYTAFYCEPVSRWTYISLTATLGIGGVILPWHPTFNRPDMNWARVSFYVSLAATGFAPVFQLSLTKGASWAWNFYSPIIKSVAVYLIGAVIYASQVPERWLHGWFDYAGGSHNIWHLAVLGGILYHYAAMESFFSIAFKMGRDDCRPDLQLA